MKQSILLVLFLAISVFGYAQKIKLSKESKRNYVSEEVLEKEQSDDNRMVVYAILRAEYESGAESMKLILDQSPREITTKAASMKFPELERLTRSGVTVKGEIDLINYLAENEWDIVSVENQSDKKMVRRKYYLRKMISL